METELQNAPKVEPSDIDYGSPKPQTGSKLDPEIIVFDPEAKISTEKLSAEDEALLKDSQPFWLTDQFIIRPCVSILITMIFLVIITFVSVQLDYFALNEPNSREYLIWDDPRAKAWDMKIIAEEFILTNAGAEGSQKPLRMTSVVGWNPMILFESKNGKSLLEKTNLEKIYEIEEYIKAMDDWPNICKAMSISDDSCAMDSYISPLSFLAMDGQMKSVPDLTQDEINTAWTNVFNDPARFGMIASLVQTKESIEESNGDVTHMRSFMQFGLPFQIGDVRYDNIGDRQPEQKKFIGDFQTLILEYFSAEFPEDSSDVFPQIMSEEVSQQMFNEMVTKDTQWAVFSVLFVFIYFIIHLQSIFLAAIGILMILFSFPVTSFINEAILRNTYYSSLHTLVIFIVLGIAADDIFVFVDAWRQSENIKLIRNDVRMRLAYSFRRAARATATTSSTTSVAFLANAFSPIMPIASFGIYAAVIITVNYALIIMVFPPLIIWYENCLKDRYCPYMKKYNEDKVINIAEEQIEEGRLEKFFGGNWNTMVKQFRYPIVGLFVVWTVVAAIFASKLSPLTTEEKFLPEDHQIEVIQKIVRTQYQGGGIVNLDIDVFWGVKDIDKSKVDKWEPTYVGEVVMDSDFDLSQKEAQQSLLDFCSDLKTQDFVAEEIVNCWTDQFTTYLSGLEKSMPLEPEDFKASIKTWTTETLQGQTARSSGALGFIGEDLVYTKVLSRSKGNPQDPYAQKNPWYEKWENYMDEYRSTAPKSMKSAIQTGGQFWAWMPSERAFLTSAFQGMTIATVFAFIILLIATRNVIQAFFSLVSVGIVIVSVLCIMYLQGWEIGISESISMVILIGFSVDYVVHLSADYMHSPCKDRSDKMQQALKEMGVSILSGSITTFGSGVFLFGGKIILFNKFAVLVTCTITFSFFVAMLFFSAIMHIMGPQDGLGDVNCNKCQKEQKQA